MSNKITLATIQFRADTHGVNPALDAMRQSSKDAHDEVERLQQALASGIKTMKDANGVDFNVAKRLNEAKKEAKDFDAAIRELMKGATALESVVKNISLGTIEKNSRAELKGAINAANSRLRSIRQMAENGTIDEESLQRQRELNTVILESQKQLNNLDRDTKQLLDTIKQGGAVSESVLNKEIKGLKEMLTLIPKGTEEWNKYNEQLQKIEQHVAVIRKQERESASALLSSQSFGRYSEEDIRRAITNGKELLATYKTNSDEAKTLAANIVRAEQYLKSYGVEAARTAAREAAALKEQEQAEKQLQTTMNKRLRDLKSLSADALAETRRYWEAQKNGAVEGTAEFNKAEAALKKIDGYTRNARRAELGNILGDPSKFGVSEVRAAIQEAEKLRDSVQKGIPVWNQYNKMVEQGKAYLDSLAKTEAAERIEKQMQNLTTISSQGLQEVKKYWETMVAGAAHGSQELTTYEEKLKQVIAEEQSRNAAAAQQKVGILTGNLGAYSESEIRQAIEAGKQLIQTYNTADPAAQALAKNIVAAEEHLKQYGVEAERAAQREAQALEEAAKKRQEADALMQQQLLQGAALSQTALRQQEQYWQRLIDDPKTAAASLDQYKANLEQVRQLQTSMALSQSKEQADKLLAGDFGSMSEGELRAAITAAREYQQTLKTTDSTYKDLSKSILDAESYIKSYGIEAARAAQKEEEAIRKKAAEELEKRMSGTVVTSDDAQRMANSLTDEAIEKRKQLAEVEKQEAEEARKGIEAALAGSQQRVAAAEQELATVEKELEAQRELSGALEEAERLRTELPKAEDATTEARREAFKEKGEWLKLNDEVIKATVKVDELKKKMANTGNLKERLKLKDELKKAEDDLTVAQTKAEEQKEKLTKANEKLYAAEDKVKQIEDDSRRVLGGRDYDTEKDKLENLERRHGQLTETLKKEKQERVDLTNAVASAQKREAEAAIELAQSQNVSQENMENAVRILEQFNKQSNEPGGTKWQEIEVTIGKLKERLKELKEQSAELRGENTQSTEGVMKLADALELAAKAGENYYLNNNKEGFVSSPEQIQKATKAINERRDAVIKLIQENKRLGLSTEAEEAELADLTKKLKDLKFEQDNLNMSQEKMRMLMKQPTEAVSLDELRSAIKRADGELKRMEGSLGENSKEYKDFAKQVKAAKLELKEMEGQAKANTSAWSQAISRLKSYVGAYLSFNIALQKVTATMGDLMVLSDKMGEVRKTTGFTADEVGRLSDNLAKLDTRTNLTGLMEFSSLAGSIGLKTQEAVQGFTEAANMIAVSLPEMGNEASRTLMKIAEATGDLEKNGGDVRETLEKVGSTIIALRANSAAAAGPITDFVSRVGAVGAQAGISIDQIAALGATVDALGGRVEMSATALSRMIPAIKNNSFAVAKAIGMTEKELKSMSGMQQMVAVFKALQDSAKGFDTSTEEGMNAMADSVEEALGRSTSMKEVMKELNQQGARAGIVFGLLSQNVDKLEEQLNTASNAYEENIALMNEYNKMNDTTAAKWEKLKNQIEEFFVSDSSQRFLGGVIDTLRRLVDFILEDGPIGSFFRWSLAYLVIFKAKWAETIGTAIISLGKFLLSLRTTTAATQANATATTWATTSTVAYGNATEGATLKTNLFSKAWGKLNTTMKANIITAVAMALVWLGTKLWEASERAKEAAAEVGRFNKQIADEQKALDNLFEPLDKSNTAHEERLRLINEINSQYGKYLGYMLSETSSAIQLADAHALIAKRIREEAYERRIAEKEQKIQEEHSENLNAAYAKISERVRGSIRGGADVQEVADILKRIVDSRVGEIETAYTWSPLFGGGRKYLLDQKIKAAIDGGIDRLISKGMLWENDVEWIRKAVYNYAVEAKSQHDDIMKQTSNVRSDLRGIQGAIKVDLANNLNTLISNVANSVGNAVRNVQQSTTPKQQPMVLLPQNNGIPNMFGGSQQGGFQWRTPWTKQETRETTPDQQMAPNGWKPNINKKDITAVRQFVQDQEALRGALQAGGQQIDEAQRRVAESWLLTDEELKEYKKIVEKADRGPGGGGGGNPYGDYNKVTSPYSEWNGDDLVKRRKEMLERVKALANGADVQAVLSEDAKFISEAVRKNITTTEQAIEWYNTERLKIQDALHAKHLTNTGDWLDPKKGAKRAKRVVLDEMKYYMDELDAFYTERKAKIQEAQNDEEISEAEARNRTLANEAEWRQRRAELQQLYAKKSEKVAKEEQDAIFDILSDRTGESIGYIQKDIAQTVKFIEAVGTKNKAAMDRIFGDLDKDIETDFLRQRNAIGKHMKAIEDIINKENPFNGIVENLRKNLGTMDILLADIKDKEERTEDKEIERTMFIMEQATKGYGLTWEEMMRDMVERGWQAWADAIQNDTAMQTGLMHQVTKVFESIQDAIKKEAAELKKQADIMWSNILLPGGDGRTTVKDAFEQTIGALGVQEGKVSRANSLIGAGQASERVADKLAIQQLKVQLAMQQYQYNLMRKQGQEKIEMLRKEAQLQEELGEMEKARALRMQADNAEQALNLATRKEQTDELKQQEAIIAKTEESEARLYKELRDWADLLTSSLQSVFEASAAGSEEYYNELAKLNLTGKGGPGAGTYVIIDNAGTSDATAHYEYLDERAALERQREIERENAVAEAWEKMWDDLNMKLSETINDQLNAMLQNQSIDANTQATLQNTEALMGLKEAIDTEVPSNGRISIDTEVPSTGRTAIDTEVQSTERIGAQPGLSAEDIQEWKDALGDNPMMFWMEQSSMATQNMIDNNKKIQQSTQTTFAKMTLAANMYGAAYQAMSNDNLSTTQKFEMMALQAVGNYAIGALTTEMASASAKAATDSPGVLGTLWKQLGWAAAPVFTIFTGLLGGLMGLATSKVGKAKSTIAQATGTSVGAGRLATGMLTYAEGNVNEFTDPKSLTPGRSYNVDAADGNTYRARYMGANPKTHITNGPEFHLVCEKGREAIIDAHTTRLMQTDDTGIWQAIQTLYNGGTLSALRRRRSQRGVRAFADGNIDEFEMLDGKTAEGAENTELGGISMEQMAAFQASLDRNSAIMERLAEDGIEAFVSPYGKRGIVNGYDTYKKEAKRHGEKHL